MGYGGFPEDMIFDFLNRVREITLLLDISDYDKDDLLLSLDDLIRRYEDVNG